ncbi:MAG: hypothetical protein ACI8QC_001452 [Planctomycetota bacterium]|jgi:hypothetical protein
MLVNPFSLLVALALGGPVLPDFGQEQTPDYRGWESTEFAGWRDWSGLDALGLTAAPDDAASNAGAAQVSSVNAALTIDANGDLCSTDGEVRLFYTAPGFEPIHEVLVQVSSPSAPNLTLALVYSAGQLGSESVDPVQITQLSATEYAYRFLLRPRGLAPGTLNDIPQFFVSIMGPSGLTLCLDALLLDARFELDGEFQPGICPPGQLNSLGVFAGIDASGSSLVSDNLFRLTASGIPAGQFGYFIASETIQWVPCGTCTPGNLCLSGSIARLLPARSSSGAFVFQSFVDLSAIPLSPPIPVLAGSTWGFQAWYRDMNPLPTTRFSELGAVTFQ